MTSRHQGGNWLQSESKNEICLANSRMFAGKEAAEMVLANVKEAVPVA